MLDCARSSENSITQRGHELVGSSPLLGLSGPDARPNVQWSPAEASAVDAQHRAGAPEATKIQLMAPSGGRTSQTKSDNLSNDHHGDNLRKQTRAAMKHAAQIEPQENGTGTAEARVREPNRDWVRIFMMLDHISFAIVHDASIQIRVACVFLHRFPLSPGNQSS